MTTEQGQSITHHQTVVPALCDWGIGLYYKSSALFNTEGMKIDTQAAAYPRRASPAVTPWSKAEKLKGKKTNQALEAALGIWILDKV